MPTAGSGQMRTEPPESAQGRIPFSSADIDRYLEFAEEKGLSPATRSIYRATLKRLYRDLPVPEITESTLSDWHANLLARGYKPETAGEYLRNARGFLRYLGCPESWLAPFRAKPRPVVLNDSPDLSREEYRLMLQTARNLRRKRAYLVIKVLCQTGLKSAELGILTVEFLEKGFGWADLQAPRFLRIPPLLREELLAYAEHEGIVSGPVFLTRDGSALSWVLVWKQYRQVYRKTGLPEEKGKIELLYRLYWDTVKGLYPDGVRDAGEAYFALLEQEEGLVGWPRRNSPAQRRT